ncbi:MAG TPA: phosphotransferase [Thermoanaerobaculia bacterium]|nr:phosphotransferase [Thermoanaerobaculia bacterium]
MSPSAISDLPPEAVAWLRVIGFVPRSWEKLAGDVSPRRYYRLHAKGGDTAIIALYPPSLEDACVHFRATTGLLEEAGVSVPKILAGDCDRGLMLLEDVGNETLYDLRSHGWRKLEPWLVSAVELSGRIAGIESEKVAGLNPPLDGALLSRELEQTWEAVLAPTGLDPQSGPGLALKAALDDVVAALAAAPRIPCHRDFMARNLVPRSDGGLVVLDHQDLRLGPPGYDLASLTNDSFFPPPQMRARLLSAVGSEGPSRDEIERAAIQRTFKAIGTYATFARRGSTRHLPLIKPTLERGLELLQKHFNSLPLPALRQGLRSWLSPTDRASATLSPRAPDSP